LCLFLILSSTQVIINIFAIVNKLVSKLVSESMTAFLNLGPENFVVTLHYEE